MSDDIFSRYGFGDNEFTPPERETLAFEKISEGATLFLYGPVKKKFNDTALYTRNYNFDMGQLAANVEPVINSINNNAGEPIARVGAGIDPYEQFTYSQRKSVSLEAQLLSNNWTFTLIFTGRSNRIRSEHLITTSAISGLDRTIYTGICSDDPFLYDGGKMVLNDSCVLEVMHKTKTAIDTTSGRNGTQYDLRTKFTDWVFDPTMFNALTTRNRTNPHDDFADHHLAPSKVALGIREDHGSFYTIPGVRTEIHGENPIISSDLEDDPKEHMAAITRGIGDFLKSREHARSVFGEADFAPAHEETDVSGMVADQLSSALIIPTSGAYTKEDLDLTSRITLGQLSQNFSLDVHSRTFDDATEYDSDSKEDNLINKLSYELGTVLQIILNRLGISNIVFAYSSEGQSNGRVMERFRVYRIGYIHKISPEAGNRLRDLAEMELRQGIFRKIKTVLNADFHVTCRSNVADITTIRLNPIGYGVKNDRDYVIPNILGGMISATVGTTMDATHSTSQLCDLVEMYVQGRDPDMGVGQRDVNNWDAAYRGQDLFKSAPHSPFGGAHQAGMEPAPTPEPEPKLPSLNATPISKATQSSWDKF